MGKKRMYPVLLLLLTLAGTVVGGTATPAAETNFKTALQADNAVFAYLHNRALTGKKPGDDPELLQLLRRAATTAGLPRFELKIVDRLLRTSPKDFELQAHRLMLCFSLGKSAAAKQLLQKLEKTHATNRIVLYLGAVSRFVHGQDAEAVVRFERLGKRLFQDLRGSLAYAGALTRLKQYDRARAVYKRVADNRQLADEASGSDDWQLYREALLKRDTRFSFTGNDPYTLFVQITTMPDAMARIPAYEMFFKRYPDFVPAYMDYSGLLIYSGDRSVFKRVIRLLEDVLPKSTPAQQYSLYNNLAAAHIRSGNYPQAAAAARKAISVEAHIPAYTVKRFKYDADYILGQALFLSGSYADAVTAFRRAFVRAPGKAVSFDFQCYINSLSALQQEKPLRQAAARFFQRFPSDPYALYWVSRNALLEKRYGDGLGYLLRIMLLMPAMDNDRQQQFRGLVRQLMQSTGMLARADESGPQQKRLFLALSGLMQKKQSYPYRLALVKKAMQDPGEQSSLKLLSGIMLWDAAEFSFRDLGLFHRFTAEVDSFLPHYYALGMLLKHEKITAAAEYFLLRLQQMSPEGNPFHRYARTALLDL